MDSKQCSRCGEVKPVTEFNKNSRAKDGLRSECKACHLAYQAKYYEANREARLEYMVKWRESNPEHTAKYREANREAQVEYCAKWRDAKRVAMQADDRVYVAYMLQNAKKRAKKKGIPFNLRPADIILPATCPVLGIPMFYDPSLGRHDGSPSLDRLDSSLGYTPDNVRVISFRANKIKNDGTLEELEAIVAWLKSELNPQQEAC